MKAIIMAGGEGSRLRPLTCDCPKPMVRFLDKPILEYALLHLKAHGVTDVGITLGYLPDRIKDAFGDGESLGISLRYYTERQPLGTAGGVKQAQDMLTETFCVLSGDGITDIDLSQALAWHKERGALATLVLKHVENPLEYGVVVAGADGRVRSFHEKPDWGEVLSDTVNTGIYILEPEILSHIPDGRAYDFGRELFPRLVEKGEAIFALAMDGYWCDIGDTGAYLRAHCDALDGKIRLPLPARTGGVFRAKSARVDRSAILEAPCFIGENAVIGAGARIGPYSVIGADAQVGARASVKRSVLWQGACAQEGSQLRACVLVNGACMRPESSAFEESVLGENSVLGARATLLPGVKIWPGKQIGEGERVAANVVWGTGHSASFESGALLLSSPAQAVFAAQAIAAQRGARELLLSRSGGANASAYARAVCAGLMAQGIQVLDADICTLPQLRHTLSSIGADGALWIADNRLYALDAQGAALDKAAQRAIATLLARGDYTAPFSGITHPVISLGRTDLYYTGHLAPRPIVCECALAVFAQTEPLMSIAERAFQRAGVRARVEWEEEMMELSRGEIGVWFNETGEQARFADETGPLSEAENELLLAWAALEDGAERLIAPIGSTRAIAQLCEEYGVPVAECKNDPAQKMRAMMQANQFSLHYDGIYAALRVAELLSRGGWTLPDWRKAMPEICRQTRTVPVDARAKGRVLRALAENQPEAELSDGISIRTDGGWVWIAPSGEHAECTVVGEASDAEFARELCDFYASEIDRLAKMEN